MSRPDGAHTHGHGHGHGHGGGGLVLFIIVVFIAVKIGHAVGQAVDTAGRVLAVALEVVIIGLVVLAVAAVVAVLTWAGLRLHRWHSAHRALTAPAVIQARAEVVSSEPQAIEAPKLRLAAADTWTRQEVTDDRS